MWIARRDVPPLRFRVSRYRMSAWPVAVSCGPGPVRVRGTEGADAGEGEGEGKEGGGEAGLNDENSVDGKALGRQRLCLEVSARVVPSHAGSLV